MRQASQKRTETTLGQLARIYWEEKIPSMRRSDLRHSCIVDGSSIFDCIRTVTIAGERVRWAYDNPASYELAEGGWGLAYPTDAHPTL